MVLRSAFSLAMVAALPSQALAQETCHAYGGPAAPGAPLAELIYHPDGVFSFTLPGAPYAVFSGVCALDGAQSAVCQIECDGGEVAVERVGDGIEIAFTRARIEALQLETLAFGLAQFDADGLAVFGTYRLTPAESAACDSLSSRAQPLVLVPGDYYPAVSRVESALALAGYFTDVPDWLYTSETEDAVKRFQAEHQLPVDGTADWALLRLLGIRVSYGISGC
jgi:hypothetical protein